MPPLFVSLVVEAPEGEDMSQTVREQLAEALEWLLEHAVDCTKPICGRCTLLEAKARKALDRHRTEPDPTPDLLAALEGLRNLVLDLEDEWLMKSDGEAPRRAYIVEEIERADKAIAKALPT